MRPGVAGSAVVSELCRRLDRLPLALELAAARTKLLAPEALLERLEDRLDLLRGARDAEERHATLRATIAWSYDLLEEDERRLLARLAVFRGGCTLDSAENVCDAQLDTLSSLLDKSLVRRRTERVGDERFWLLETIREFASERLEELDEANEIRIRHAKRMLAIARSAHLSEDDMESDVASGLAERDDFRAALDWAEENDHSWVSRSPSGSRTSGTRPVPRRACAGSVACSTWRNRFLPSCARRRSGSTAERRI